MKVIQAFLYRLLWDEEGATAVEYGVLIALIIAAVVLIIATLGQQISVGFQSVATALSTANIVTP